MSNQGNGGSWLAWTIVAIVILLGGATLGLSIVNHPNPLTSNPGTSTFNSGEFSVSELSALVGLSLQTALLNHSIPDYSLIKDKQNVVLSTENLDGITIPQVDSVNLVILSPQEIQARANAQGDFLYLRFSRIAVQDSTVIVGLDSIWMKSIYSNVNYLSGGGFTIQYHKQFGNWVGSVTSYWIS